MFRIAWFVLALAVIVFFWGVVLASIGEMSILLVVRSFVIAPIAFLWAYKKIKNYDKEAHGDNINQRE